MNHSSPLDLERLFHAHQQELIARLQRIVGCCQTAADLAQGAYVRLLLAPADPNQSTTSNASPRFGRRSPHCRPRRKMSWCCGEFMDAPALLVSQPLHFGDYGGMPLKILWAVLDLITIAVLISGLYLWWKKRHVPEADFVQDYRLVVEGHS